MDEIVSVIIANIRPLVRFINARHCTAACSKISRIGSVDGYDVSADNFEP